MWGIEIDILVCVASGWRIGLCRLACPGARLSCDSQTIKRSAKQSFDRRNRCCFLQDWRQAIGISHVATETRIGWRWSRQLEVLIRRYLHHYAFTALLALFLLGVLDVSSSIKDTYYDCGYPQRRKSAWFMEYDSLHQTYEWAGYQPTDFRFRSMHRPKFRTRSASLPRKSPCY